MRIRTPLSSCTSAREAEASTSGSVTEKVVTQPRPTVSFKAACKVCFTACLAGQCYGVRRGCTHQCLLEFEEDADGKPPVLEPAQLARHCHPESVTNMDITTSLFCSEMLGLLDKLPCAPSLFQCSTADASGCAAGGVVKPASKGRGRPLGSKNRPKEIIEAERAAKAASASLPNAWQPAGCSLCRLAACRRPHYHVLSFDYQECRV